MIPALALVVIVWLSPSGDPAWARECAYRVSSWYQERGISVEIVAVETRPLPTNPCEEPNWWMVPARVEDGRALYVVDSSCPVWEGRAGMAYLGGDFAIVNYRGGLEPLMAHEIVHLLGAPDDYDGYDIASAHYPDAYRAGRLSVESWIAMGGEAPTVEVYLPLTAARHNSKE